MMRPLTLRALSLSASSGWAATTTVHSSSGPAERPAFRFCCYSSFNNIYGAWVWVWVWDGSGLGLNFLLASVSFTLSHTLSLDSFCRPTTAKSSSPLGLFPLVYVYIVYCETVYPYIYSSSTHRFPDEHTPIEATPLSTTSAELGMGLGLVLGLDSLSHFSSHTLPFFLPPSFHTLSLSPVFTSAWWSDQSTQTSARHIS